MDNDKVLQQKLILLPNSPGVYLMKDSLGNVIYVGKAKNLKNRVTQYFYKQKNREPKVEEMIQNIANFEYRVVDTELDAFLQECRLIKEIKPLYNRQLKNDQKYVYLKIPNEEFPKIVVVSERREDGAQYYGPFNSRHRVDTALQYLNDSFLLRKCSSAGRVKISQQGHGCLYRQLGTCLGVCTGKVNREAYGCQLRGICQVIEGRDKGILKEAKDQLEKAVAELNFERAARYREYILGLQYIQGRQKFLTTTRRNRNLLAIEILDKDQTILKLFLVKGNKLVLSKVIKISRAKLCYRNLTKDSQELREFLKAAREKLKLSQGEPRQLTHQEVDEARILDAYLRKDRVVTIRVTQKTLEHENFVDIMLQRINETLRI